MPLCCALLFNCSQLWQFILLENVFRMSVTSVSMLAICMLHTCSCLCLWSIVIFWWGWGKWTTVFAVLEFILCAVCKWFFQVQPFFLTPIASINNCLLRLGILQCYINQRQRAIIGEWKDKFFVPVEFGPTIHSYTSTWTHKEMLTDSGIWTNTGANIPI